MHIWTDRPATQGRYTRPLGGVDLGSEGRILAEVRCGDAVERRLVWFKGGKRASCGVRGFGQESFPTELRVIDGSGFGVSTIFTEGRLSQARLAAAQKDIDKAMACDITSRLETGKTVYAVIGEGRDQ